jgi:hypothetical protein
LMIYLLHRLTSCCVKYFLFLAMQNQNLGSYSNPICIRIVQCSIWTFGACRLSALQVRLCSYSRCSLVEGLYETLRWLHVNAPFASLNKHHHGGFYEMK